MKKELHLLGEKINNQKYTLVKKKCFQSNKAVYYIKILVNEISNSLKISSIKIQQHQQLRFEEKARDIEKNIPPDF